MFQRLRTFKAGIGKNAERDRLIDVLASLCVACIVYRLYGLTEDEIAIAGGKMRWLGNFVQEDE